MWTLTTNEESHLFQSGNDKRYTWRADQSVTMRSPIHISFFDFDLKSKTSVPRLSFKMKKTSSSET